MLLAGLPLLIDLPGITAQELKDLVLGERVGNKILYVQIIDRTPPLMAVIDGFMNFFFGRSILARHILALIILFFQAAYFGILLISNKAYNENTYVPSLIFGFLCFFSFDLLALTPDLLASTLLLLALNNIFKEIEFRVDRDSVVLNLGIFLGLASLIVFSYIVFLAGAIFVLVVFARTSLRKILLLLLGFGLAHMVLFTFYYAYGHSSDLWTNFYLGNLDRARIVSLGFRSMLVLGAVPIAYFVISVFMLTREARFTRYQSQIFQVLFLWMFLAAIQMIIAPEIAPHAFMTFLPPMAYLISHYLLLIRRKRIAEFMLWIFLLGILSVGISARQKWITQVDYSAMFSKPSPYADRISNKRIMIVGEDIDLFRRNSLGGFFLDWDLSHEYFEHPEYYNNIIRMNEAFNEDAPDVIIDELNLMEAVLDRLPRIRKLYKKDGLIYWRI